MHEAQPSIDIFFGASDFFGEDFDGVILGLQLHEGDIAACFIELVHIGPLQIFDELEFADACRNVFPHREFRGAKSPRTCYELIGSRFTVRQRANENGLKDAVEPNILGQFGKFCFIELASRIPSSIPECV